MTTLTLILALTFISLWIWLYTEAKDAIIHDPTDDTFLN